LLVNINLKCRKDHHHQSIKNIIEKRNIERETTGILKSIPIKIGIDESK